MELGSDLEIMDIKINLLVNSLLSLYVLLCLILLYSYFLYFLHTILYLGISTLVDESIAQLISFCYNNKTTPVILKILSDHLGDKGNLHVNDNVEAHNDLWMIHNMEYAAVDLLLSHNNLMLSDVNVVGLILWVSNDNSQI
ncbi:hypothetical protein ACJX0J_007212 [Zea mays]